jgi:hypothetical protein
MQTFIGQVQIDELQAAQDYQDFLEYRESLGDFDREFPFDNSPSSEPTPEFRGVYSPSDVDLFRMFGIVGSDEKPLFKITKLNKIGKCEIAKIEKNERAARIAKYAEHYANPTNEGITPIRSIFEAVEDGEDFHLTPLMLAMLSGQDEEDSEDE